MASHYKQVLAKTVVQSVGKLHERVSGYTPSAKPAELTPPRTHVNTATTGLYTGNAMGNARPDAGKVLPGGRNE